MLFTLIVHPDKVQRATLRHSAEAIEAMDFVEFDTDAQAFEWLASTPRKVDFIFTPWDLTTEKKNNVARYRATESTSQSLIFQIGSRLDLEWISTLFTTRGIVEELAARPFRVSHFIRCVQELLTVDLMAKPCALVVEDDEEVRHIVRDYLREFGFSKVLEAPNGIEAMDMLNVHRDEVSVVLSDWQMPGMTGIELLRKIRKTPQFARMPFMMITSQTPTEQIKTIQAAETGVNGYILKPFNLASFRSQMEFLLQDTRKRRRAEAYLIAGRVLLAQGNPKSEETIAEGIKLFPNEPTLWEALGDIRSQKPANEQKTLQQACDSYEQALKLSPLNTPLVMKCFEVYTQMGRMNDAVRILRGQFHRAEFDDGLYTRLGKVYLHNGDYEAACQEFQRAITSNPTNTEAQSLYQIALSLGQNAEKKTG